MVVRIIFGIYICAEIYIQTPILYALLTEAMTCAFVFVIFTHFSLSFSLFIYLILVMYLLEDHVTNAENGEEGQVNSNFTFALFHVDNFRQSFTYFKQQIQYSVGISFSISR